MDDITRKRMILQEIMNFLGAIASGIEEAVGDPANSITFMAGKKLGMEISRDSAPRDTIMDAIEEVNLVLQKNGCFWKIEPFKVKKRDQMIMDCEEGKEIMLVFRDCMIRQTLFTFGHHQKGSLCNMMYGVFSGALQNIMGKDSRLEIVHAGENACYKRLTVLH